MEFGPRALGARSILGDARSEQMQSTMNLKIKFRESFRPFAPSVLEERVDEYFETRPNEPSPYMLLVAPVRKEKRFEPNGQRPRLAGNRQAQIEALGRARRSRTSIIRPAFRPSMPHGTAAITSCSRPSSGRPGRP